MAARLDKLIWAVRLFKTRTLAANECKKNHVLINDEVSKPSKNIKLLQSTLFCQHLKLMFSSNFNVF